MPVRKYRSVKDMEDAFWITPATPAHRRAVQSVLESVSFFTAETRLPHGVFRFHSVEEASAQREEWERNRITPTPECP